MQHARRIFLIHGAFDKCFKEIWSYDIPKPWAAIRLKNGNMLITDEQLRGHPGKST